jgi:hypothetical protein
MRKLSANTNIGEVDLFTNGTGTGGQLVLEANWTTNFGEWRLTGTYPTSTWHHHLLTYDNGSAANNPTWYVDGILQSLNKTSTPAGTPVTNSDPYALGNRPVDLARVWGGQLAWWTIWSGVLLNASEAAALAAGVMPFRVRPASIVSCIPLWGLVSPEIDFISGNGTATVSGTAHQNDPPLTLFTAKTPFFMPPPPPISVPIVLSYNVM